jgi:pyruvate, water dikinase
MHPMLKDHDYISWFDDAGAPDIALMGGKNAALGELARALGDVRTAPGFALTTSAYWAFVDANGLRGPLSSLLAELGVKPISEVGERIRALFLKGGWPDAIARSLRYAYRELGERTGKEHAGVAVRSSATAEDLPTASFAGQLETYLNVRGEEQLLDAARRCLASLFTDRAIAYRIAHGFDHMKVALSVGVQAMVRSDLASAGVMFSIDTETGFDKVVVIDAAWGLGENLVQGAVDPDRYEVFKPLLSDPSLKPIIEKKRGGKEIKMIWGEGDEATTRNVAATPDERAAFALSDAEILQLGRWACLIEAHYGRPMDMEWAKDGETGELFVVQARPETVQSQKRASVLRTFRLRSKGKLLVKGLSIGEAVATGPVCRIDSADGIARFTDGAVLVTKTTDPDWVPIMKRAAAIVTDHGGRTSHAAIVSRELGLPAVIGSGDATEVLRDGQIVTVSCAEGADGFVYEGAADVEATDIDVASLPKTWTQIMLNLADPASAFRWWRLPADGIGLARMEFVIGNHIKAHPMALLNFRTLKDEAAKSAIAEMTVGFADKAEYFVDKLARGLARIAAAAWPKPVIIRTSDFKTNEYAHLVGGAAFEPREENPMLGLRGASRYYLPIYRDGFALECRALKRLREEMGFANVIVMIPFCRSPKEADRVLEVMAENGLRRGENGLKVYVMCEIPSNVILAEAFASRFDGFSIGSNDLTQLTLGVDRDSAELRELFNEQDEAVQHLIGEVIQKAHRNDAKVGLCGQAPSDHPEFAAFLVEYGIDSISVTPDSFVAVKQAVAKAETQTVKPALPSVETTPLPQARRGAVPAASAEASRQSSSRSRGPRRKTVGD